MPDLKIGDNVVQDIRLVIFDRDGTLINLYHYWSNMVAIRARLICELFGLGEEDVLNLMSEMGIDLALKRLKPQGPVGLKKRDIVMQAAVDYLEKKNITNKSDACLRAFEQADAWSLNKMNEFVRPIKGAFELVDALVENNCKVAIATTDKQQRCEITMEAINKLDVFSSIVGVDTVANGKPSPDMIDLITTTLLIHKANTVMVGDATSDVKMGLNADVKASVGVCSGLTSRKVLSELTKYVIEDVSQIKIT